MELETKLNEKDKLFEQFKDNNKDYKITRTKDDLYLCMHKSHLDTPLDRYARGE